MNKHNKYLLIIWIIIACALQLRAGNYPRSMVYLGPHNVFYLSSPTTIALYDEAMIGSKIVINSESVILALDAARYDGKTIVAAGNRQGRLKIIFLDSGKESNYKISESITCIFIDSYSNSIYFGTAQGKIHQLNYVTRKYIKIYQTALTAGILDLYIGGRGESIVASTRDKYVYLWSSGVSEPSAKFELLTPAISVCISEDESIFVAARIDGTVEIFEIESGSRLGNKMLIDGTIYDCLIGKDATTIFVCGNSGNISVWERTYDIVIKEKTDKMRTFNIAFTDGGKTLISLDEEGLITKWATSDLSILEKYQLPKPEKK